jgi:Transposase
MRAYSIDLRVRVLADSDDGMGATAVAAKYRVSESWARRLRQRRQATGETAPRPSGRRKATRAPHAEAIRATVRDDPDATLAELKRRLGLAPGPATLRRAAAAPGPTVEERSSGRRSGTAPTSRRSGRSGGPAGPGSTR